MSEGFAKLTVMSEQHRGKVFELTKDLHTCGRVESRDIFIKDPTISSYHCDFVKNEDGSYKIVDRGRTNGSRVNNVPITEKDIINKDVLQVGSVEMLYVCDDNGKVPVSSNRSTTGITVDANKLDATPSTMKNVNKFSEDDKKKGKLGKVIMIGVIVLLAVVVLGLLALLLKLIMK